MDVSASIKVRVVEGRNLTGCNSDGTSDPYVIVKLNGEEKQTHKAKKTRNPVWDCGFVFPVNDPANDTLTFEIWDKRMLHKDNPMGNISIPLSGLVINEERLQWVQVIGGEGDLRVGLTANGFDTRMLVHPDQPKEVESGGSDVTQISGREFSAPQRWEVQDPNKFYGRPVIQHPYGTIQVTLNKPYYIDGEQVVGQVHLRLNVPLNTHGVFLKYFGQEKVRVTHESSTRRVEAQQPNQHSHTHDVFDYHVSSKTEKHKYFKDSVTLQPPGLLNPGDYVWSFSITLPQGMPGVFYNELGERKGPANHAFVNKFGKGGVRYVVKANVDIPGSDVKVQESLIMSERLSVRVLPISETRIKTFTFRSGEMRISAEVGKNVFCPGESIPIRVKIDNQTKKACKAIKIKLWRKESIKNSHGKVEETTEVHRQTFAGCEGLSKMDQVCTMVVPSKLFPTTHGKLCECEYTLDIEADLPMAFDVNIQSKIVIALLPAPEMVNPALVHPMYGTSWQWGQ